MNEREHDEMSRNGGIIMGLEYIHETPSSIIFGYAEGNTPVQAIYNKKNGRCPIYSGQFVNSDLGNLKTMQTYITEGQDIITYYTPDSLLEYLDQIVKMDRFKNKADKEKFQKGIAGLKEDDNPVVFRYKLKKDSRL